MNFAELHHQNTQLLLANVWDATSARAAEQAGYPALGTSSAAIAAMLGYADGEGMSFDELFYIVSRIKSATGLPLSVDIEAGFGESAKEIAGNLKRLSTLGIVGVNLEDSRVVNGVRQLDDASVFAEKLKAIRGELTDMFINVRSDPYLVGHGQALQETLTRGRMYQEAGADGFFIPCLTSELDIATISREIALPLNVMCMPDLPDFRTLTKLGIKRISMGNFVHASVQATLEKTLKTIASQQSFAGVFLTCKQLTGAAPTEQRQQFELQLDTPGSDFQRVVWQGLRAVPYGETAHYQALAEQIDKPNAVRAVAAANGANRVAIVIPCHRIIGKDGTMTGYGGGIARKEWLINHEKFNAIAYEDSCPPAAPSTASTR
ncbi:carboxyvinyl-carboxyphosphonate phosphorylmutase [Lelliottia jeotgali]|nr:carboxyvinyl-carboxyphosphonate phosphorylmutase [Lelliottia jeotgali]